MSTEEKQQFTELNNVVSVFTIIEAEYRSTLNKLNEKLRAISTYSEDDPVCDSPERKTPETFLEKMHYIKEDLNLLNSRLKFVSRHLESLI